MRLRAKCKTFVRHYETLVEYFTDRGFKLPQYFYREAVQLLLLLEWLGIDSETFLVSNFRMYSTDEHVQYPYPYLRYLLHNPGAFKIYETHHRDYGDTVGVINYSKVVKYLREMKQDTFVWLGMSDFTELEKIKSFVVHEATDIFKIYIKNSYFDMLVQNKIDLHFYNSEKLIKLESVLPYNVLDRIFKEQESLYVVGGQK